MFHWHLNIARKKAITISTGNHKYKHNEVLQIVKCDNIKIMLILKDLWTSINGIICLKR